MTRVELGLARAGKERAVPGPPRVFPPSIFPGSGHLAFSLRPRIASVKNHRRPAHEPRPVTRMGNRLKLVSHLLQNSFGVETSPQPAALPVDESLLFMLSEKSQTALAPLTSFQKFSVSGDIPQIPLDQLVAISHTGNRSLPGTPNIEISPTLYGAKRLFWRLSAKQWLLLLAEHKK